MKPFLIILTGHAPETTRHRLGDFDQWFRAGIDLPSACVRSVDAIGGENLPDATAISGAIISGSASMVTDRLDWSERLAGWIRTAMDARTPLLGVCYGHQLMAHALGGRVGELPSGREMGTCDIELLEGADHDALTHALPRHFAAQTSHRQCVLEIPPGATVLARSRLDPHHILRYAPHAWSTQLHPEFSVEALRGFIQMRADTLRNEGRDVASMLGTLRDTPDARALLPRFARLACPQLSGTTENAA